MKKKIFCSIIFSILSCTIVATVYAEADLKIPETGDLEIKASLFNRSSAAPIQNKSFSEEDKKIYLSKDEVAQIKKIQSQYNAAMTIPTGEKFTEKPILKGGTYKLGVYNPNVLNSLESQLNFYRELAHLIPTPITEEDNEFAQYGAIGMASVYKQTHYLSKLEKPADMSEDFWFKANEATSSSNIHSAYKEWTFNQHLDAYITDYGQGNKETGHRANTLGMQAISVGQGFAETNEVRKDTPKFYTVLYINSDFKGISSRYENDFVTQWPAQGYFPIQLYNKDNTYETEKNMRWSVFFNSKGYTISDEVSVEITNEKTGEKTSIKNDSNGGELLAVNPNPGYYPQGGYVSVNFKPNNDFNIESNVKYTVNVNNILKDGKPYNYSYSTYMMDVNDEYIDNDTAIKELQAHKKQSKELVSSYKEIKNYRETEQKVIQNLLKELNNQIDNASDKLTVDKLVNEAKVNLDKIKTDKELSDIEKETTAKELQAHKKQSKELVSSYKEIKNYRETEQKVIQNMLKELNNQIDNASDKPTVDKLVNEAKVNLDKIKTDKELSDIEKETTAKELQAHKKQSKELVSSYKEIKNYRETEQKVIQNLLKELNNQIDNASDKPTVDKLVNEAKVNLDKIKTDKELSDIEKETVITYEDSTGTHKILLSKESKVQLSSTSKSLKVVINDKKYILNEVKNVTFKGITVDKTIAIKTDTIEKITLENVTFSKGIKFTGMKNIESLFVKNSKFGGTSYSLEIKNNPKITDLRIDYSEFNEELRIVSNKALYTATLSNSLFKDDIKQRSNKEGYVTESINNRFENSKRNK